MAYEDLLFKYGNKEKAFQISINSDCKWKQKKYWNNRGVTIKNSSAQLYIIYSHLDPPILGIQPSVVYLALK